MNIINLQEHRISKMADSHDAFRVAAALLGEPYRAKNHKPAPVSKKDQFFHMQAQEAEEARLLAEKIRRHTKQELRNERSE